MNPTPESFADAARTYLGVPFRLCGRDRTGLDCGGLISLAMEECGLGPSKLMADLGGYPLSQCGDALDRCLRADAVLVTHERERVGDILTFRWDDPAPLPEPVHAAIVTDVQQVLGADGKPLWVTTILHNHFLMGNRRVVEHRMDEEWEGRLCAVWRLKAFV